MPLPNSAADARIALALMEAVTAGERAAVDAITLKAIDHKHYRLQLKPRGKRVAHGDKPYIAPARPGVNDPCPCGSGLKFKKCHKLTEEKRNANND